MACYAAADVVHWEGPRMGFLKRVLGGGNAEEREPGPAWAQPMGRRETDDFVAAVRAELERRGMAHDVGEGSIRVERNAAWNDYGLSNLAQLCHQLGRREWGEAIASHFGNLFAAEDADAEIRERARTFDGVRDVFKVRLYPGASLGGMEADPPARWELASGLTAAFVYDLPTSVATANVEQVRGWDMSRDELLAAALDNVRADAVECQAIGDGGRSAMVACVAEHFFAASHALLLSERLRDAGAGQAVFAVPHRHALLYAPMVDMAVVQAINQLIPSAVGMFNQGPGSISPGVYWWRDGSVTLLPAQFDGQNVQFAPPDDFVAALNALSAGP